VDAVTVNTTAQGFVTPATPELRIRQWQQLSDLAEAGGLLTEQETRWMVKYAKSSEYTVMKMKLDASSKKETA
jgi:hypothetical protein